MAQNKWMRMLKRPEIILYMPKTHALYFSQTEGLSFNWSLIKAIDALTALPLMQYQISDKNFQVVFSAKKRTRLEEVRNWSTQPSAMKCPRRAQLNSASRRADNIFPLGDRLMQALLQSTL